MAVGILWPVATSLQSCFLIHCRLLCFCQLSPWLTRIKDIVTLFRAHLDNPGQATLSSNLNLLFSCWGMSDSFVTPWTATHQAALSSPIFWSLLKFMPLSQWCYLNISSSVTFFSFCLQSFPASEAFLVSWLFTSGGQSIGASASVLPMTIQDWFPLGLTGLISLQSKGLLRVFSSAIIWKYQFFGAQPYLWSSSHIWVTSFAIYCSIHFLPYKVIVIGSRG